MLDGFMLISITLIASFFSALILEKIKFYVF